MTEKAVALSIAGSDTSGGAGIQVDLRMFSACGVFGTTVLTALTAQHPFAVTAVVGLEASFVKQQIETLLHGLPVKAVKTGMLWSAEIIECVAQTLPKNLSLVVDPVMISTVGAKLITDEAIDVYRSQLLPRCTLATPNIDEAVELLGGEAIDNHNQEDAVKRLVDRFGCAVLLKGGHLTGDPIDMLYDGQQLYQWQHKRLDKVNTHGSGCMLSAAITAGLARGFALPQAVQHGLDAVHQALANPVTVKAGLALANLESLTYAADA